MAVRDQPQPRVGDQTASPNSTRATQMVQSELVASFWARVAGEETTPSSFLEAFRADAQDAVGAFACP